MNYELKTERRLRKELTMTNEEAKQEAIRKAYGEFYKTHRFNMDADGWCGLGVNRLTYNRQIEYHPVHSKLWRPITLNGIENNNGWTRIEPDGSNLPDNGVKCKVIIKNRDYGQAWWIEEIFYSDSSEKWIRIYSHFKTIREEEPPIW